MVTNIKNNISEHFLSHLAKFVHITFNFKGLIQNINDTVENKQLRKELKSMMYKELNKIINDIVSFNDTLTSKNSYHKWIKEQRKKMFPYKNSCYKNVYYDLKSNPLDYLYAMFYINS